MNDRFLPRLGTFFILIGWGFLVLFIGAMFAGEFSLSFLILTIAAFLLGSKLRKQIPASESARFSSIRRLSQRSRLKREDIKSQEELKK